MSRTSVLPPEWAWNRSQPGGERREDAVALPAQADLSPESPDAAADAAPPANATTPLVAERHSSPAGAGFATPAWCGASFGPHPTSGQYSQGPGTQRKASPWTAT